jgi:hypothetical protein
VKPSIKAWWNWLAVWVALLGGCYWTGGRFAIGAPTPPCNATCLCVDANGWNEYKGGVLTRTRWFYIAPPLGAKGLTTAAATNVVYIAGRCGPPNSKPGTNQMFVADITWADACTQPVPPPDGAVVAQPPQPLVYPLTNPGAVAGSYCGN